MVLSPFVTASFHVPIVHERSARVLLKGFRFLDYQSWMYDALTLEISLPKQLFFAYVALILVLLRPTYCRKKMEPKGGQESRYDPKRTCHSCAGFFGGIAALRKEWILRGSTHNTSGRKSSLYKFATMTTNLVSSRNVVKSI
jgi:hypothetical protein